MRMTRMLENEFIGYVEAEDEEQACREFRNRCRSARPIRARVGWRRTDLAGDHSWCTMLGSFRKQHRLGQKH